MMRTATARVIKERRKFPRLPLSGPLFVRGIDRDGKKFLEFASALNISAGGVLISIRRGMVLSADLQLEVPVAPLPPIDSTPRSVRTLKGKLIRIVQGDRSHLVAVKFMRPLRA